MNAMVVNINKILDDDNRTRELLVTVGNYLRHAGPF